MNAIDRQPLRALTRCAACGASIAWAFTTKRRPIPLNPNPTRYGNLILTRTSTGQLVAMFAQLGDARSEPRFTSHFATCPEADKFRAPRKRSGAMRQP